MTKKIFRSTLLVAVCALLASLVLIMGCLYDYFAGLQSQALRDELTLAASGVSQGGEGGAHRGGAICPAELHKVLRVPVRVVGAHVAHRGRSDLKHRPCPQRCVARGSCGERECERPRVEKAGDVVEAGAPAAPQAGVPEQLAAQYSNIDPGMTSEIRLNLAD